MASIDLKIPTLVQNIHVEEKSQYYVRPLFLNYPVASNRRFDLAVSALQKEVKQLFKGYQLSRENASQLFWYLFHPQVNYKLHPLNFNLGGSQYINGLFGIASFELKGLTFVCIPLLNNYMFICDGSGPAEIAESARRAIEKQLKRLKKEQGEDFIPDIYFSTKKEFLTTVEVDVNIKNSPYKFGAKPDNWFFNRLSPQAEFDGGTEIEKVGYNLNSLYPAELQRAFYREELVTKIGKIIFQERNIPFVLVGPEGVGKHTLMHEAVWQYEDLQPTKKQLIWHVDPGRIISGMSIVGMWQKRFESIIRFVIEPERELEPQARLMIDNPVALLRIGKSAQNNMSLSDVLKPHLEKRNLQLTLLATPDEWKIVQEIDRRFSDLFQVIRIEEPTLDVATK